MVGRTEGVDPVISARPDGGGRERDHVFTLHRIGRRRLLTRFERLVVSGTFAWGTLD